MRTGFATEAPQTHAVGPAGASTLYTGLDTMPIAGEWRSGRSDRVAADVDPWNTRGLVEHRLANRAAVDAAFESAREAQRRWAPTVPVERRWTVDEFTTDHWVSVQHAPRSCPI